MLLVRGMHREWQSHEKQWNSCQRCDLHKITSRHVLVRGTLPCDFLFVGEAPGSIEDILGFPFVGPAGQRLDKLLGEIDKPFSYAITNVVACTPRIDKDRDEIREPTREESTSCRPRIIDLLEMARPIGLVYLGRVAERFASKDSRLRKLPSVALKHPAYLLRLSGEQKLSEETRFANQLTQFIEEVQDGS